MAAMEFMMDDVPMMDENPSASAELKSAPMPLEDELGDFSNGLEDLDSELGDLDSLAITSLEDSLTRKSAHNPEHVLEDTILSELMPGGRMPDVDLKPTLEKVASLVLSDSPLPNVNLRDDFESSCAFDFDSLVPPSTTKIITARPSTRTKRSRASKSKLKIGLDITPAAAAAPGVAASGFIKSLGTADGIYQLPERGSVPKKLVLSGKVTYEEKEKPRKGAVYTRGEVTITKDNRVIIRRGPRGKYACRRCGAQKKGGHVCERTPDKQAAIRTRSVQTQVDLSITLYGRLPSRGDKYKVLSVKDKRKIDSRSTSPSSVAAQLGTPGYAKSRSHANMPVFSVPIT